MNPNYEQVKHIVTEVAPQLANEPIRMATAEQVAKIARQSRGITEIAAHHVHRRQGIILFEEAVEETDSLAGMAWLEIPAGEHDYSIYPVLCNHAIVNRGGELVVEGGIWSNDLIKSFTDLQAELPFYPFGGDHPAFEWAATLQLSEVIAPETEINRVKAIYAVHRLIRRHGIDHFALTEEVAS